MKVIKIVFLAMLILMTSNSILCQAQDWRKLVALESNREEVEKIIGKPHNYFETYGRYETKTGKFSVWYSQGGCHKNVEGLQWDVTAQKMTRLLVYLHKALPLESYISNIQDFEKIKSPDGFSRYFYTSPDETIIYETIRRKDSSEFVYTIEIQPSKAKQHLLCKDDKGKK